MSKRVLVFAPCAYNLAETTRMIQIAKGVSAHDRGGAGFDIRFISEGGDFEYLIQQAGFPVKTLEPRVTPEKVEHLYKLDKAEAMGAAYSRDELIEKIDNELEYLRSIRPVAIVTGSYVTMPLTHKILGVPLVWVVQSTWLEAFFTGGAGMTEDVRFGPLKKLLNFSIFKMIDIWMRISLITPLNKAAAHFGVGGFKTIFEYWRGDLNLVAEPPDFTGAHLSPDYRFIGPVIAREDFPIPAEVLDIPRDRPLIYFAMGSSGTPEIVKKVLESFEGKPYRVIAPVRSLLKSIPNVSVPGNVVLTDWLPAHEVNRMADLSVIHGGIGTIMTAAYAGKPIVGVGMQPEQSSNLAAIERKGFAVRIPKSGDPSKKIHAAIQLLLSDDEAKRKATDFAERPRNGTGRGGPPRYSSRSSAPEIEGRSPWAAFPSRLMTEP